MKNKTTLHELMEFIEQSSYTHGIYNGNKALNFDTVKAR